ncbi:MAG: T9SS type A sorting domain-containing protein [Balneola sp.]|nr:T9SS type A sorting domain-containing protein [Balneola sp.]MBO6711101.1 T9SS type A sorting domain-containing protein [Balneola sp.]MBO6800785.1 T9SS type A sorting domain-containing protein [Balneola sp.]MBO6869036.1 T9SS type A sorting domain-containing protein [Balneola sp.]
MAGPLQNKALFKTLHIALIVFVIFIAKNSYAQSLLLPGDIVFVSINATSDEFELVPLIDLKAGTKFSINNGEWDNTDLTFRNGSEVNFVVNKLIEAGTPLKFGASESEYFSRSGQVSLSPEKEQLFIYQKDEDQLRFLYALGWGERDGKRDRSFFGSEIPEVLKEMENTVLRLGTNNNYQYYIRNGASGTQKMLLSFISDGRLWRGNDEVGFPDFGTSFNLLKPPVILFDESLSTVKENKDQASLNVAIYEHDGSKLTVEVVFDSVYSSLSRNEANGFRSQKINFTGLIGDAVYEIEIPITNDDEYEGMESAIFSLQNLSNGRLGDFISHTVLVSDDDLPEIKLEIGSELDRNILMIHNLESKEIDLRNWELLKGNTKINFPRNTFLRVGESIVIAEGGDDDEPEVLSKTYFLVDEEQSEIFKSSGTIQLKNNEGFKVSEIAISNKEENKPQSLITASRTNTTSENRNTVSQSAKLNNSVSEMLTPGWKSIQASEVSSSTISSANLFYWDTQEGSFEKFEGNTAEVEDYLILVGYFDETAVSGLAEIKTGKAVSESNKLLEFTVEATDIDKNGMLQSVEGLNLIKNTSDGAFAVNQLISGLKEQLDYEEKISVYKSTTNFSAISKVGDDGFIFTDEIFWLKFNSEIGRTKISIDPQKYSLTTELEDPVEKGMLEFEINGNSKSSNLKISFLPEEIIPENSLDLKLYEELYLSDFNELVLTSNLSENRYNEFEINTNASNISSLPLNIVSTKSGELELKVKKWTDIPDGWVIKIEDLKEEKSYEIHENWSLKFNYSNISQIETDKINLPSIDDRFVLKVIPKDLVVEEDRDLPVDVELHQNYPNPFNPTTVISFYMPEEGMVKLSVFNIVGQPVAVLLQENKAQGEHSFEWDASDLPSGIYIYQLEVGTKIMTRKMTLVK